MTIENLHTMKNQVVQLLITLTQTLNWKPDVATAPIFYALYETNSKEALTRIYYMLALLYLQFIK